MESGLTNPPALIGTGAAKGVTSYSSHQTVRSRYRIRLYVHSATYGMDALSRIQGIDTVELLEKGLHHKHSKGVVRLN